MKIFLSLFLSIISFSLAFTQIGTEISNAALELTKDKVIYDPSYYSISYPNGDVPSDKGVCTDVIIRAFRKLDIDLQKEVHEDMKNNFSAYPKDWGLKSTDRNIDHRRVPNLMKYFERQGASLPISNNSKDYKPGDVVSWKLQNGMTHIGIVVDRKSNDGKRPMIVHNIGAGQVVEDCLFSFKITGHYRFMLEH
ncbi:DUF1287 domain-containing protein [Brumimicrobium glaciale]|uniref:DUF1287 domain-containing protein n=1 Tax=Brumimicrobium glaciale TaxID=200475 RepID=A0A4Q4KKN8_9FLAO|nr:DUF1287 domain-containing protein [Brumimicrobium glaciale]RYM33450.1 DUF1287 domain-containing protein [Brumimicrobium glaciale]